MRKTYKESKNFDEIMLIKFIQDMLKEYPTYSDKIANRIDEMLEELKLPALNYLKDQEQIEQALENDKQLNILKNRKAFLDVELKSLEKYNKKAYIFIQKRYFDKRNLKDIIQEMNLSNATELFDLNLTAIRYLGNKIRNSKDFLRKA